MFRFNDFYRNAWPVLLTAALSVSFLAGCRNTGRQPVAATPVPPPYSDTQPPILLGTDATTVSPLPEPAQAFRPITPESIAAPTALPTSTETPILQKKIDDLNTKVAELEKKLAEKDKELQLASAPAPIPSVPPSWAETPQPLQKVPPVLPTISVANVSSSIDGDNVRIRIPDAVLFQPGTVTLSPNGEDALRSIAAEIRTKYPDATLEFEGHTDSLQTDPMNTMQKHEVAGLKSQVVAQYFLQTMQWKTETIATSGHGSNRPVADNGTPEGRAQNNRIEIVVK